MNIYVGNRNYDVRDAELRELFERYGEVGSAEVIIERRSGRSRGYAFVVMPDDTAARAAIEALNGTEFRGRTLRVDVSRPKEGNGERRPRSRRGRPARAAAPPRRGLLGALRRLFGGG